MSISITLNSSIQTAPRSPIQDFNFDGQPVRIVTRDGEPWFVAADVCRVLDIGNPSQAVSRLDDDEKHTLTTNEGGNIKGLGSFGAMPVVINESGLYALVLTSRKPEAKRFKRWITWEVLPGIRRTGSYGRAPVAVFDPNDPAALRAVLLGYTEKVQALQTENAGLLAENGALGAKVEHFADKAETLDRIAARDGEAGLQQTSKEITGKANALIDWMSRNGWLFRRNDNSAWIGRQDKIDSGYLVVRERPSKQREDRTHPQTMVTPKGRVKLASLWNQGDMLKGKK